MIYDTSVDTIQDKVLDGQRITAAEAVRLYHALTLPELGALANVVRERKHPERRVTYIIDRNINYTNVCDVYCTFCAFMREERDDDSYVLTPEQVGEKIKELVAIGGVQILMQGGHHPKLGIDYYLNLLQYIRRNFPQVNIHGFSPPEFNHFANVFKMPVEEVIRRFKEAGLGSIPGGGGEILVDRLRQRIAPLKCMSDEWLRDLQDRTHGFTAFICWTFQSENTRLKVPSVGSHEYLRMQALSRIFLDNFANVQSSWVTQGPQIGQVALKYGANDFGSVMMEENVVSQAGATFRINEETMQRLIRELGYEPHRRDNWYHLLN